MAHNAKILLRQGKYECNNIMFNIKETANASSNNEEPK